MNAGAAHKILAMGFLALGILTQNAAAISISTPAGLNPGDKFYVVFVTTGTSTNTADVATYDAFVAAEGASLEYFGQTLTWQSVVTTASVTAISRFNPTSGIYLIDGTKIADNGSDLWDGSIDNPINLTPEGFTLGGERVWTGTNSAGAGSNYMGAARTYYGVTDATNSTWVAGPLNAPRGNSYRIYASSNELTAVPEPSVTALLIGAGVIALILARRQTRRA